jgi:uncharacterized protein YndB with AHSA1/START domain
MAGSPLSVVARQWYGVAPDMVFRAFTEPQMLTRWFSPGVDIAIEVLAHDLRPHGRYRFKYTEPSGAVSIVCGEFCVISRPTQLIFTWTWEPPDPHAGVETLVTIDLTAERRGTLVVVTHERFPDQESCERHEKGWRATLARLPTA